MSRDGDRVAPTAAGESDGISLAILRSSGIKADGHRSRANSKKNCQAQKNTAWFSWFWTPCPRFFTFSLRRMLKDQTVTDSCQPHCQNTTCSLGYGLAGLPFFSDSHSVAEDSLGADSDVTINMMLPCFNLPSIFPVMLA